MLPSRRVPAQARAAYRIDRAASLLAGLYTGAIFPFVGIIARESLHATGLELSIWSAAPFAGYLLALFYANFVEGGRVVRAMTIPVASSRVVLLLLPFARTSTSFVALLSLGQVLLGLAGPATASVVKAIYPDDTRGRIMSYTRVTFTVASALIAFPAGWLLKQADVGYRVVFPVAALIGLGASATFLRMEGLLPPAEAAPAAPIAQRLSPRSLRKSLGQTWRFLGDTFGIFREDTDYRWFAFSVFTYGFGNLMLMPLYPIYQVDRLHISTPQMALLAQVSQVTMIFAYFYWGRYVDILSPLRAVVINVLLNALIPIVYYFSGSAWALVPAFVLVGITNAGIDLSYFNSILTFASEENVARYQALHSFLLGIRGTLAPFAGVAIMNGFEAHGLDAKNLFLVSAAIILVGCAMQLFGVRTRYDGLGASESTADARSEMASPKER